MKKGSMKKVLSGLLAASLLAVATPGVLAKNYIDVDETNPARDQIDILSDIGVIVGTSENEFSPDENVTREQMALLLFRLMLNKADGGRVNTSPFLDLNNDAYYGAISWANASGYILGTSASEFEPLEGIMLQDAMAILVRALGHSTDTMNQGYPWTYIDKAIQLGLDQGLENMAYTETLTRAEAATILYNALMAEYLVPQSHISGIVLYESTSIIEKVFGYQMEEATVVATNHYTLTGSTVIKDGFVQLQGSDNNRMSVKFSDLGLSGDPDDFIGKTFRIVYRAEENSNLIHVLNTIDVTQSSTFTEARVDAAENTVTLDGNVYKVVSGYSNVLETNDRELLIFAYDNNRALSQISDVQELAKRMGLYSISLIENTGNETQAIAILRNYQLGQLSVTADGSINLADGSQISELSGGYRNDPKAENGDFVLYYFNAQTKELVIAQKLEVVTGTVTRITATTARINGQTYHLGNETAGISGSELAAHMTLGGTVSAVLYQQSILHVIGETVTGTDSEYLIAMSEAYPVFTDGAFRYVITANIDGVNQNVYVNTPNVVSGQVYRYTVQQDTLTLIPAAVENQIIASGVNQFVQNSFGVHEIAWIADSAQNTKLTGNGTYFTLESGDANVSLSENGTASMKFVMDRNTVLVVMNGDRIQYVNGKLASALTIRDGASVTAIFRDEIGSVETLRYLFVTDGSIGEESATQTPVRILSFTGIVFENGKTFGEYSVFNYATGKVEEKLSTSTELVTGDVYFLHTDGSVSEEAGAVSEGVVQGYTQSSITLDEETYGISEDVQILKLNAQNQVETKSLADAYQQSVDYMVVNNTVVLILIH